MTEKNPGLTVYETITVTATSDLYGSAQQLNPQSTEWLEVKERYASLGWEHDESLVDYSLMRFRRVIMSDHPDLDHLDELTMRALAVPSLPTDDANDPMWLAWYPMGPATQCVMCGANMGWGVDQYRRCQGCAEGASTRRALLRTIKELTGCIVCGQVAISTLHPCDRLRCRQVDALQQFWDVAHALNAQDMPKALETLVGRYQQLVNDTRAARQVVDGLPFLSRAVREIGEGLGSDEIPKMHRPLPAGHHAQTITED